MNERGRISYTALLVIALVVLGLWNLNLNSRVSNLQRSVQELKHQTTSADSSQKGMSAVDRLLDENESKGVIDQGATSPNAGQDSDDRTVYITRSGRKHHGDGCRFLSKSKIPISLKEAEARGYTPCSVCGGG